MIQLNSLEEVNLTYFCRLLHESFVVLVMGDDDVSAWWMIGWASFRAKRHSANVLFQMPEFAKQNLQYLQEYSVRVRKRKETNDFLSLC